MFLVVYIKKTLLQYVADVKKSTIPLGVLSMIGDKGAVMI